MARLLAALLATLSLALPPQALAANTWGTDLSDMWWIPAESGWGANIAHQGEIVFMTLYVYGSDNRVRWYAATAMQSRGGAGVFAFDGTLYEFAGPYFGMGLFDPSNVGVRQAGTASLVFSSTGQGTLNYTIDGFAASKAIQRQTFRENNLAGSYLGASSTTLSGCATGNGRKETIGTAVVSHSANNAIAITTSLNGGGSCNYAGTYAQGGRMGQVTGSLSCSDGSRGTFAMNEIEAGYVGLLGWYSASLGGSCSETGTLAWLKR
jgi:hypothetical protein